MDAESESVLLRRFSRQGDAEAFSKIVRHHVAMVYGVCLRILADQTDAADVTQETFFLLLRQAREVSGSLASWLHTVATRKSIDFVRRNRARTRREEAYAAGRTGKAETWQELSSHVDGALEELDETLRQVLVERFFEGKTTTQIALDHNISQATVSRRINQGLNLLQASLKRRGLLATVAGLSTFLAAETSQAVPAAIVTELSKMAMLGSCAASAGSVGTVLTTAKTAGLLGIKAKLVAAAALAAAGIVGYTYCTRSDMPAEPQAGSSQPVAANTSIEKAAHQTRPANQRGRPDSVANSASASEAPYNREGTFSRDESPVGRAFRDTGGPYTGRALGAIYVPPGRDDSPADGGAQSPGAAPGPDIPSQGVADIDLGSPEAAIRSFVRLLERGRADDAGLCFVNGAEDALNPQDILNNPQSESERQFGMCLQSLGPPFEVKQSYEDDRGLHIVWRCMVRREFSLSGRTWPAGATFELNARLVEEDGKWRFVELY